MTTDADFVQDLNQALTDDVAQVDLPGYRHRHLRETILAYLMIAPAATITIIFGLYPVLMGLWVSLKQGVPVARTYVGLDNYTKAMGSFAYVTIFVVAFSLFLFAYRHWVNIRTKNTTIEVYWLLLPSFVVSLGVLLFIGLFIINGLGYAIQGIPLWVYTLGLIGLGVAGFILLRDRFFRHYGNLVLSSLLLMSCTLFGVLAIRYAYSQMIEDAASAQRISTLIFNNNVGNAKPLVPAPDAVIAPANLEGEIPVTVKVGDQTYETTLAPQVFEQVTVDNLAGTATITLKNQAKVIVNLPIERGFGMEPIYVPTEGVLQLASGTIGGGGSTLEVQVAIGEDAKTLVPFDIYNTGRVGETLVSRGGRTVPLSRPLQACFGLLLVLATAYFITDALRHVPEEKERLRLGLILTRIACGIGVLVLGFYIASTMIFYQQAANGLRTLTPEEFDTAYQYTTGNRPPSTLQATDLAADLLIMPQVILIAVGAFLIVTAYLVWTSALQRQSQLGMWGNLFVASALMVAGWVFISELPAIFAISGPNAVETRDALIRTAIFSFGTVPPQLMIGLALAYMMFYEVNVGKGFYRLIYFMPYVTPRVATATVFTIIFSLEASGLANQALGFFGIQPQLWLKEPDGLVRVIYQILGGNPTDIPSIFEGPSLAITTVIIFNVWVYAGYNAVIFLAGLGSIPSELYEAAKVDGAGRWQAFRNITLPLLSPVTFFLSLLSITGTFRTFGSIYTLGSQAFGKEVDTMTVVIFKNQYEAGNSGYAASLAFILFGVIILLTITQNRLTRDRIFYG